MSQLKQLPTGIQTFADLRNGDDNYYYVDKTKYLIELTKERAVFLSRPRRFGKSMTLSTIGELFAGNKKLFTGLYAENHWDWSQQHAVLRISFGSSRTKNRESVEQRIEACLLILQREFDIETNQHLSQGDRLQEIIFQCYEKTGKKVVVLVDEYDKPILDSLHNRELTIEARDALRGFYGAIKDSDQYIRFAMLTGVSQFSKVNLFSGINHLTNITLMRKYSAICGYTQDDLETVFAERLGEVDLPLLKRWYNGYNWCGECVYNPYDVLLFLNELRYSAYWYGTGTPTFLIDLLIKHKTSFAHLDSQNEDLVSLAQFDIDNTSPTALMFQTGYLTIDEVKTGTMGIERYTLKYPNLEVQMSLNEALLSSYLNSDNSGQITVKDNVYQHLQSRDFDRLVNALNTLFASIPHDWYRNNAIARYEGYWSSVFFIFFSSLGYRIIAEDTTSHGRIDVTLDADDSVFLFEFKVIETIDKETGDIVQSLPTGTALKQLLEKRYAEKYQASAKPVYQIGLEFSEAERKIVFYEVQEAG